MKNVQTFIEGSSGHIAKALSRSRVVITSQDMDLRYVSVINPSPGYENTIGKKIEDFADPRDVTEIIALKDLVLRTREPQQAIVSTLVNGEKRTYDMTTTPMVEGGEMTGLTTISVDLTDLLAAQEELQQAQARLIGLLGDTVYGGSQISLAKHKRRPV